MKDGSKRRDQFKQKMNDVSLALGIPLLVYAATGSDTFRKPRIGMWEEIVQDLKATSVDLRGSFFIGDAAGRAKDHSCSDRKLAANLGLDFHTPEEYFLGSQPEAFSWGEFNPATYSAKPNAEFVRNDTQSIVLCVGYPCSGKSMFCWKVAEPLGYSRINQDTLKTREKCLRTAESELSEGASIIVDNTNADKSTRQLWVHLAKKHQVGQHKQRCKLMVDTDSLSTLYRQQSTL